MLTICQKRLFVPLDELALCYKIINDRMDVRKGGGGQNRHLPHLEIGIKNQIFL